MTKVMVVDVVVNRVRYGAGRGGAGFHSAGPPLTTGRGGYFVGDPRPAPVWGESPLIRWTGPRFSPPVLTGTRLGNGRGRGQGQGTIKSMPRPGPFSGPGRGIGPGACVFRGPGGPVTNTSCKGCRLMFLMFFHILKTGCGCLNLQG